MPQHVSRVRQEGSLFQEQHNSLPVYVCPVHLEPTKMVLVPQNAKNARRGVTLHLVRDRSPSQFASNAALANMKTRKAQLCVKAAAQASFLTLGKDKFPLLCANHAKRALFRRKRMQHHVTIAVQESIRFRVRGKHLHRSASRVRVEDTPSQAQHRLTHQSACPALPAHTQSQAKPKQTKVSAYLAQVESTQFQALVKTQLLCAFSAMRELIRISQGQRYAKSVRQGNTPSLGWSK